MKTIIEDVLFLESEEKGASASYKRNIVISVFLGSGVISLAILLLAWKKKAHKSLLSEFMMYIIISEIINCYAKVFSFIREDVNKSLEKFDLSWYKVLQLYICLIADFCTLYLSLIISLKIYDGIVHSSKIFNVKANVKWARLLTIIFPLTCAFFLGTAQIIYVVQTPEAKRDDIFKELCDYIACRPHGIILFIECLLILFFVVSCLTITVMAISFLWKKKKELREVTNVHDPLAQKNVNAAITVIKASTGRLYFIPIVNTLPWIMLSIVALGNYFINFYEKKVEMNDILINLRWVHSTCDATRGILYSIILLLTKQELLEIFCCCACGKKLIKTTDDDDDQKQVALTSEFNEVELNLVNLDNEL